MKKIISILSIVVLTACGGGGDGNDSGDGNVAPIVPNPSVPEADIILGGPPSAPVFLSLNAKNAINNNPYNNYFKYTAVAGERLIFRANLGIPLSGVQNSRCAGNDGTGANPSSYASQIHIYNAKNVRISGICGEDLEYTFLGAGVYTFNFEFPSNGAGFFNVASISGETPVRFSDSGLGSPIEHSITHKSVPLQLT